MTQLTQIKVNLASIKGDLAGIKIDMRALKWLVGINFAATIAVLVKVLV
jgi:hypothetical protein